MAENQEAGDPLGLFDHMLLLLSLPQSDIQWHFGAAKLEAIDLQQYFGHPPGGQ